MQKTIADIVSYLKKLVFLAEKDAGMIGDKLTDDVVSIFDAAKAKLIKANEHYQAHVKDLGTQIDDQIDHVATLTAEKASTVDAVVANAKRIEQLSGLGS